MRRIRHSVIAIYLCSTLTLVLLLSGGLYLMAKHNLDQELGRRLMATAQLTVDDIAPWRLQLLRSGDESSRTYRSLQEKLKTTLFSGDISRLFVFDLHGRSLLDSDPQTPIGMRYHVLDLYRSELEQLQRGTSTATPLFRDQNGHFVKQGMAPIIADGELIGFLAVQANADFFSGLRNIRWFIVIALILSALVIAAISLLVARRLVRPIEQLTEAAKKIGAHDLETKIALPQKNEIGTLARTIDQMRRDLREKETRMQTMLQGIAHEVRTPLSGIELFAGLLKEELPAAQRSAVSNIDRILYETGNLKLLVDEFLDFAHTISPEYSKIDPQTFLHDSLLSLRQAAEHSKIRLETDIDARLTYFWMDPRLMRQVVANMVDNSIQAIRERLRSSAPFDETKKSFDQAQIMVSATRQSRHGEEGFVLAVEDNGCGIPAEHREQLFQPFFTTKEKGCGLGLAFCKKIVRAHGGQIDVESQHGVGTTIHMWIANRPAHEPGAHP